MATAFFLQGVQIIIGGTGRYIGGANLQAPSAFADDGWTVTNLNTGLDARISITALPGNGGDPITDIEYRRDGGTATSLSTATVGTTDITVPADDTDYTIELRAINSTGTGPWSSTKPIRTTAPAGGGAFVSNILQTRTSVWEGGAVRYETDGTDTQQNTLQFKWTTSTAGTHSNLDSARLRGRDAAVKHGPFVAFRHDTAGTETITCEITDGTDTQTIATTTTVTTQDSHFPLENTICVDEGGVYGTTPTGAQTVSSIPAAIAALESNGGGRILFHAGKSFNPSALISINGNNLKGEANINEVCIDRYGSGANPAFDISTYAIRLNKSTNDNSLFTIGNIDLDGGYDAQTGISSLPPSDQRWAGIWSDTGFVNGSMSIYGCTFTGTALCVANWGNSGVSHRNLFVSDCVLTNWRDMGVWNMNGNFHVWGNTIRQNVDATSNYTSYKNRYDLPYNYADHGPIRAARGTYGYVGFNDMLSNTGWSSVGGIYGRWTQPCYRVNTGGWPNARRNTDCNQMEGGSRIINLGCQAESNPAPYDIGTFRSNHLVGTAGTVNFINIVAGGVYFENNICTMPDTPTALSNQFQYFVDASFEGGQDKTFNGNNAARRQIVNNHFIDLRSTANQSTDMDVYSATKWTTTNGFTDYEFANNVTHAPNRTAPDTSFAPLSATGTWSALYKGRREDDPTAGYSTGGTLETAYDTSGTGSTGSYAPTAGNTAVAVGTSGTTSVDDFDKIVRDGTPFIGAFDTIV